MNGFAKIEKGMVFPNLERRIYLVLDKKEDVNLENNPVEGFIEVLNVDNNITSLCKIRLERNERKICYIDDNRGKVAIPPERYAELRRQGITEYEIGLNKINVSRKAN